MPIKWTMRKIRHEKILISHLPCNMLISKLLQTSHCFTLVFYLYHYFFIFIPLHLLLGWLGVSHKRWTLAFTSHSLTLVSVMTFLWHNYLYLVSVTSIDCDYLCLTCNPWTWAKDNTFGYLHSSDWAQIIFHVFGSTGLIKISIIPFLRWVKLLFFCLINSINIFAPYSSSWNTFWLVTCSWKIHNQLHASIQVCWLHLCIFYLDV